MKRTTCLTCGKAADRPYRRFNHQTGEILYGCVDDFHAGCLMTLSNSSAWHNRKEAKVIRKRLSQASGGK